MPVVNKQGQVTTNGHTNGAHPTGAPPVSPRRAFGRLLPSAPIPFPYPLDEYSVVYDLARVMSLDTEQYQLIGDLSKIQDGIALRQTERALAFDTKWADYQARNKAETEVTLDERKAYNQASWDRSAANDADNHEYADLARRKLLRIIEYVVVQVGIVVLSEDGQSQTFAWPQGVTRPDPAQPDTWADVDDLTLRWLTETGVDLAKAQVDSFLSAPPSKGISLMGR